MLIFSVLHDDILEIEKTGATCSPTFVVDDFEGLFLHKLIISTKDLRSV